MSDMKPSPTSPPTGTPAVPLSVVGQPGGVASLGSDGKVPAGQINSAAYMGSSAIAVGTGIDPTGATDSTTALQAKIDGLPTGGTLFIPVGTYKLSAALTISKSCRIVGESVAGNWTSLTSGGTFDMPLANPPLLGTVLNQTVAATDGITITASGSPVHLENLGILFTGASIRWVNTGHGVNSTPTQTITNGNGTGHDHGVYASMWRNVIVYGHDGNHYGFKMINSSLCTVENLRSYGGGMLEVLCDSVSGNYGNLVAIHPYGDLICAGTAHGYHLKGIAASGGFGVLNLITMIRPQCNADNMTAALPTTTAPANTQYLFRAGENFAVDRLTILGPDLESGLGNPISLGAGNHFIDVAGTPALSGTPTLALAAGIVSGSPGTISQLDSPSSDNAGTIDITVGSTNLAAFSDIATVTFGVRTSNPIILLTPNNGNAAAVIAYIRSSTNGTFTIGTAAAMVAGQRYKWNYMVTTGTVLNT